MNHKRAVFAALPLFVLMVALWFIGKYQPKTIEIEGAGAQIALRALTQACRDYPLARQITVRHTLSNSAIMSDELNYNRREQQFLWTQPNRVPTEFSEVEEDDVRALGDLTDLGPRGDFRNDATNSLLRRGCRLMAQD